jgi:sterol desaturase/sphingolipid hydroxylase (fatty acid hydroxylase superfamily)
MSATEAVRLAALAASCLGLWWLERRCALVASASGGRRRIATNLTLAVLVAATSTAVTGLGAEAAAAATGWTGWSAVTALPAWLVALVGIALMDLSAWAGHVAMHKTAAGWSFHRVHHSDTTVDVTTSLRQHPLETVWRISLPLPIVVALGLSPAVVAAYFALSALFAQLEHANIRWEGRAERLFGLVFVTPLMHKWHHSRAAQETDTNYGNIFSVWDRVFGTRTARRDLSVLRYGLDGLDEASTHSLRALLTLDLSV